MLQQTAQTAMHASSAQPALRLVHPDVAPDPRVLQDRNPPPTTTGSRGTALRVPRTAARRAARPPAAPVSDHETFARAAAMSLEHGRAAVLVPERRRKLMMLALHLGIRPFDASLIIALAQDRARRGERFTPDIESGPTPAVWPRPAQQPASAPERPALDPTQSDPQAPSPIERVTRLAGSAVILGLLGGLILIRWVQG